MLLRYGLQNRSSWSRALARIQQQQSQQSQCFSSSSRLGVRVAIVGSGPSGSYTAKYLKSALKNHKDVHITVLDRLPTPFGLVRSGVAPDHPEVKNVQNDFSALFDDPGNKIGFMGNVNAGKDVSLEELRKLHDVVVLAYGCESDRKLGIEGEETLTGILSAREFVAWYNGHPDFGHIGDIVQKALGSNPGESQVVVVGQGNVALDCARVLAKGKSGLIDTDIATRALDILQEGVQRTTIVGRRGHVQGAFTIKELRELTKLEGASFVVRPKELDMGATPASLEELEGARPRVRIDKLLRDAATKESNQGQPREVHLRFLMSPVEFLPQENDASSLGAVVCERTRLEGDPGKQTAVGTGEYETIPAQLALVSIGYKGVAVPGLEENGWFDTRRGVVVHSHGKIDSASDYLGGLYVSGWLKRGPSGIIGTNIADAKDTVASITKDLESQSLMGETSRDLASLLAERGVQVVDWNAYQRIDTTESDPQRKRSQAQPREKITDHDELLRAAL